MLDLETAGLFVLALALRIGFFLYGIYQDEHFDVKYTDVDYFVFHDAANYVFEGLSPYLRDTYRYTPLLSWLLVPNHQLNWVHFGKMIFVLFDLLTGILILALLETRSKRKRLALGSLWLLNFMVITISTRGNAESVLCFFILFSLYCLRHKWYVVSGLILGIAIHLKIYPIIYSAPVATYIFFQQKGGISALLKIGAATMVSLGSSCYWMYRIYGYEFLEHAYFYHMYRTDHRHNFSIFHMLLYFESAFSAKSLGAQLAFLPQAIVTMGVVPLVLRDQSFQNLLSVLFVQTYAFVTFNKVCTSQYFIWYLIFLPFYLARTKISKTRGLLMATAWIVTQALWLSQGYLLEFQGRNVFFPGLFFSSVLFFLTNVWILGQFIQDLNQRASDTNEKKLK
ncbi:LANO_0E15830g1_1 [Lachancea nothofagi CBS 11611]|uniref:GPI mannosyltransferase 1 n=1 Tax=Lachancea nothofagi CBS 11611 TaxID=1266666 RepID=A0A1G4K1F5_9SACH|nr:LANO_0E15830g1_1 [Lachancea nothofagi CBS 11611]